MVSTEFSSQRDREKARNITPTICVGLGGTGREVLIRVRRIIVEEFGSLDQLPIISFVQIDTDRSPTIPDHRGQSIAFKPPEEVHIRVSTSEVNEFKENYNRYQTDPNINNPDRNILEWFPGELVRNLNTIEHGAGAVRAVGRFALFKNYEKIRGALNLAYGQVVGANHASLIARGIEVRPGLRVFVAGSLCGGTGSGIFLDIAYILRQMFAENAPDLETHAYFVISADLYGDHDVVKANCYAALKELDYYTRKGTNFDAQYPNSLPLSESRPPYDYVYLISNSTPSHKFVIPPTDPNAKGKIFNTIAQKICMFVTSNVLADAAISARDNLRTIDAAEEYDKHPRPNRQRYMTAGLASIYFPQDKICKLASNKIKLDVLQFWKTGLVQAPTITQMQTVYFRQAGWETENLKQVLENRLKEVQIDGQTVGSKLRSWFEVQQQHIRQAESSADCDKLKMELLGRFRDLLNNLRLSEKTTERGTWLTVIVEQTPELVRSIEESINNFLEKILQPDHQFFCVDNALIWLHAMKTNLEQIRIAKEPDRPENVDQKLEAIIEQMQNEVQIIQSRWWPFGKVRGIQSSFQVAVRQVRNLAEQNYQWQLTRQVNLAVEQLIEFISHKIRDMSQLKDSIQRAILEFEELGRRLEELNVEERIGTAIISPEDINNVITNTLGRTTAEHRVKLGQISTHIIENVARDKSNPSLYDSNFYGSNFEEISRAINQVVDKSISDVADTLRGSAIERFIKKGTNDQLRAYLDVLRNQSEPLLPLNLTDGHFSDGGNKLTMFIAYHQPPGNDPNVEQFENLLREMGIQANAQIINLPDSEKHQIIFMTEYAGFPLRIINGLNSLKISYNNRAERGEFLLHTRRTGQSSDHNRPALFFTDILPVAPEIIQRIRELFCKCLGLGILQLRGDDVLWLRDSSEPMFLGSDWLFIIDKLSEVAWQAQQQRTQYRTPVDFMNRKLEEKIDHLRHNPQKWYGEYRPRIETLINEMRAYPSEHINFSLVKIFAGTTIENLGSRAHRGILEELIDEIDSLVEPHNQSVLSGDQAVLPVPVEEDNG